MNINVDLAKLAGRASRVFLSPSKLYPWPDIMQGCVVLSESGAVRRYQAVDKSTFRALHRQDKSWPVGEPFIRYFVDQKTHLIKELSRVQSRVDIDSIADEVADGLRSVLGHLKPSVLASYHKLRKPVDLALENLVTMSLELDQVREMLVPLLFLPLDSKMFGHPLIFTNEDLARFQLSRNSVFGQVPSREAYLELQDIVSTKAQWVSEQTGKTFYPVYFDMLWGSRHRNWGGNLFETIPEKRSGSSIPKATTSSTKTYSSTQKDKKTLKADNSSSGNSRKGSNFLSDLLRCRPELAPLRQYIGNNLADNYIKGLNGPYHNRLQRGIQAATGLPSSQLVKMINFLIADRGQKGDEDAKHLRVPSSEEGRRALILALWTSREIGVREGDIVDIVRRKRRVYGNEYYLPQPPNIA